MIPLLLAAVVAGETTNPVPVNNDGWMHRHQAMVAQAKKGADLVFIGDSITHAFGGEPDTGESFNNRGADSWSTYFGDRRALNLGISGDRTQNVLWRIDNGEMDGLKPRAVVIMIGTNNVAYNTAPEIVDGVEAIVDRVHRKTPKARVLLLAVFPRGNAESIEQAKLAEVNERLRADATRIKATFLDIGDVFLDDKKEIPNEIMPDKLHPFAHGYRLWAMAMEPTLAKLMRVKSKFTGDVRNSALVPVTHNRDYPLYDWMPRHKAILEYNKTHQSDLVFIGDSITHRFGGPPIQGAPIDTTPLTGKSVWEDHFAKWNAVNLGFGWDRTENVLWRIEQGELDGIKPKAVVLLIGTNNIGLNSITETKDGIIAVVEAIKAKQPHAHVLVCGVLPRGEKSDDVHRGNVKMLNEAVKANLPKGVEFIDNWESLIEPNGTISKDVMFDFLHPTEVGYERVAKVLEPVIAKHMK